MPTLNILSTDPTERLKRARCALDGLSVGDALGGVLSPAKARTRSLPTAPWYFTDDTLMALSIYSILRRFGKIDQDELARDFALHFIAERGYGPGMRRLLPAIGRGEPWKEVARKLFGGSGSLGNGGAMRIGPLGAYFADDLTLVGAQAHLATEVTHCHPEGIAGGVA